MRAKLLLIASGLAAGIIIMLVSRSSEPPASAPPQATTAPEEKGLKSLRVAQERIKTLEEQFARQSAEIDELRAVSQEAHVSTPQASTELVATDADTIRKSRQELHQFDQ